MSIFGIFKQYLGNSGEKAAGAANALLARIDREGYTEAVMDDLRAEHSELAQEAARARIRMNKEVEEANSATEDYNNLLATAKGIKADLDSGRSEDGAQEAYEAAVARLQAEKVRVQTEQAEADAFTEAFQAVEAELLQLENELRNAETQLKQASANAQVAEAQKRVAERKAETAQRGNRKSSSSLAVGLAAFNQAAEDAAVATAVATRITDFSGNAAEDALDRYQAKKSYTREVPDLADLEL